MALAQPFQTAMGRACSPRLSAVRTDYKVNTDGTGLYINDGCSSSVKR